MLKKIILNIIKITLFLLVIWYIYTNIAKNIEKIKEINFKNYDPKFMFFFVITLFISLIYPVFVWKYLLRSMGEKINTLSALRIWFVSNLGRYVPGKVLQIAGLVYLANKEGVSKSKAIQSVLYSQITANGLGLFMGLGLLLLKSNSIKFPNSFHLTLILIALFIFLLWIPSFLMKSSNFVLEKFKKQTIEQSLCRRNYMIYLSLQIINWILMSISFILFVNSYTGLSIKNNPETLFILPLSWTIGLIALFAPGGIGVREGAMSYWLSNFIPIEFALVLPWIYRIMNTIVEIILTLI
ncbi:MAG: flippase-like domain-containing protein, partial [Candidatus Delongbacteria bacterium]|nr:flippase-like domain-containing protein [Candidatus Delongbacteria bacterium]